MASCSTNNNTETETRTATPIPTPGQGLGKSHVIRDVFLADEQQQPENSSDGASDDSRWDTEEEAFWTGYMARLEKKEKGEEEEDANRRPSTPQVIPQPPNIETPPRINFPPLPPMSWEDKEGCRTANIQRYELDAYRLYCRMAEENLRYQKAWEAKIYKEWFGEQPKSNQQQPAANQQ